jgi:hypothetical protein
VSAVKVIRLRWPATCSVCHAALPKGASAAWDAVARSATCELCRGGGEAGGSAQREHDQRAARERHRQEEAVARDAEWRRQTVADHPIIGRLVTAVRAKPVVAESQSTRAWADGAVGERRVGEVLAGCAGVRVLHDRRLPRTKANIDHLAVGPSGVFVIDAKRYAGGVETRGFGRQLFVGNRNRTALVLGMGKQVEAVRAALAPVEAAAPILPVLCFVGADWPRFFARPLSVQGVTALWPGALAELVARPGQWTPDTIDAVARALALALPPASP